ncbi:hypothetical protein BJY24_003633 [Nocardia transvalensis]|uniref:RDD domain-containing protein n=1 Tax=Nocardia transvalensis TaxID=37333 RepID=A0A7W9PEY9_9NOCA|nr:RDD family protein [Nocardia transvalensis]MBB5914766.1 hypothetical protein [Nocardia transvalensis]
MSRSPRPSKYHGDEDDPRYPSPRFLRSIGAVVVDVAVHGGIAFAVGSSGTPGIVTGALAVAAYLVASFVNTTLVQWVLRASVGKALFGLAVIRGKDGGRPTFGNLLVWYFLRGINLALENSSDGYQQVVAVRRRDIRRPAQLAT